MAGPPKAGTTSLYQWLADHPDAHPSLIKEPDYFNDIPNPKAIDHFSRNGWPGYEKLFGNWNGEKVIFEASPKYIYSDLALSKLNEIDKLKVVFLYREEPDRLYSEYRFHRYKTQLFSGNFDAYLKQKGYDISKAKLPAKRFEDYVSDWIAAFGSENVSIIDFKSLISDPEKAMKNLCNFLGLDPSFYSGYSFDRLNKTQGVKNRKLHYWLLDFYDYIPKPLIALLKSFYYRINGSEIPKKSVEEAELLSILTESIDKLSSKEARENWNWL